MRRAERRLAVFVGMALLCASPFGCTVPIKFTNVEFPDAGDAGPPDAGDSGPMNAWDAGDGGDGGDAGDGGPPDAGPATTCLIGGKIYDAGARPPGDVSKCCNPVENASGWTPWFASSATIQVGAKGTGLGELTTADFDGNGRPDIAVGYSGGVAVLLQQLDGSFSLAPSLSLATSAAGVNVRRIPGNPLPDLVARNSDGISLFSNLGNGNFSKATTYWPGDWIDFVVGNWSGGPSPDVLGIQLMSMGLYLLPGIADGGLGGVITSIPLGFGPYQMASGDFRGIDAGDVAIVGAPNGDVTVLLDDGNGNFGTPAAFDAGNVPYWVRAADMDGDGRLDLIVVDKDTGGGQGAIVILQGDGAGGFVRVATFPVGSNPESAAVVDLNQDGWKDVVVASDDDGSIYVLWNQGPAVWSVNPGGGLSSPVQFLVGTTPRYLNVADFNGDGAMDLVVANSGANTVQVLLNSCAGADAG